MTSHYWISYWIKTFYFRANYFRFGYLKKKILCMLELFNKSAFLIHSIPAQMRGPCFVLNKYSLPTTSLTYWAFTVYFTFISSRSVLYFEYPNMCLIIRWHDISKCKWMKSSIATYCILVYSDKTFILSKYQLRSIMLFWNN